MRYRERFDREVLVEECWIPTRDGTRLHARIWRPADAVPVPALLEYLPYRKGDWTAPRDAQRHPYYAGHGYASVRVDLRGSGNSEGVMLDEYTATELADGVDVIEWLADQPWCTGKVGMFGISWGGFNALQIAALRPEPLKAIVTVCSTDDRYDNDVHYTGGAVLGIDMAAWAGTMLAFTARPPDPSVVGDEWLKMWRERLDAAEPFLHTWLAHQERDNYWRHGSICEDYAAVQAAVLAVGGWADPYRDTVFRLAEHLRAPVRGIVGPWSHQYPDRGLPPGPSIGFLQETLRWWDHWLKDADTGVLDDPLLRTWIPEPVAPSTCYSERPGRWVGDDAWPSPSVQEIRYGFDAELSGSAVVVASPEHTGIDAGRYFPFGNRSDLPPDQREEDGRSVCFDSAPLAERVEILGRTRVSLRMDCDVERANITVRLCDVAPDGSSMLVTRGVLNLLARNGRERADPWRPGEPETVTIDLSAIGHAFPPGHRIRVAVSTAYFPWVWPHGARATVELDPAASALVLPVRAADSDGSISFEEPEQAPPLAVRTGAAPDRPERVVRRDVANREWILEVDPNYGGSRTFPDGLTYTEQATETYRIREDDPLSATATSQWTISLRRADWLAEVNTTTELRATREEFIVDSRLDAAADGETVVSRHWRQRIPRSSA
ncbi:CocE/NonD family hydrolase [Saccharopolyspora sp. K220]|uniref:CocE/NonD family hydrolase n=1 Tax=Saccharopolyspora soli TaxID=2926618 RepID=UPI001F586C8D|nr:CocE/NonD family hydrolase [Saccharopolyspora soli]MCI2417619.1 CocE/NonD family hydrolase [Saccharopolyspora soli]